MCCSTSSPGSIPRPRKLRIEDRFALSNDDLKTKSRPAAWARCAHSRAIIIACSGLSITQGPAIIVSRPSPNVTSPTENGFTSFMTAAEYTLSVFVRVIRSSCFAQLRDVHDQAARRRLHGAADGLDVRRARDCMMPESEPFRSLE